MSKPYLDTWNTRATPQWISVEDRLPELSDSTYQFGSDNGICIGDFLVIVESAVYKDFVTFRPNDKSWSAYNVFPTHWQPLPEPPTPEN